MLRRCCGNLADGFREPSREGKLQVSGVQLTGRCWCKEEFALYCLLRVLLDRMRSDTYSSIVISLPHHLSAVNAHKKGHYA